MRSGTTSILGGVRSSSALLPSTPIASSTDLVWNRAHHAFDGVRLVEDRNDQCDPELMP